MGLCCTECFANKFISNFIKEKGTKGKCDYCRSNHVYTLETKKIGEFVREKLRVAYENVQDTGTGIYWDSERKEYIEGENVFEVLAYTVGIFSEKIINKNKEKELSDDFMSDSGPDWHEISQGADDYFEGGNALLVLKKKYFGEKDNRFISKWDRFKYQCKHYGRYFDFGHELETRESLLKALSKLLTHESLETKLEKGEMVWRAREINEKTSLNFNQASPTKVQSEIGPPPNHIVQNNRMSPAGISYTYISENPETSITEVKPSYGSKMIVGQFQIIKDLKLLDLTSIPNYKVKNIFDPSYDHDMIWAKDFMEQFIGDITEPCSKSDALIDYIPTQLLAEYIRKEGFDGIKFESSLNKNNINYTLFYGPMLDSDKFEFSYYDTIKAFTNVMQLKEIFSFRLNNIVFPPDVYNNQTFEEEDFKTSLEHEEEKYPF